MQDFDWHERRNKIENDFSCCVLDGGKAYREMAYGELWSLCERFVLMDNLRVCSWNALREWMWGSEEWRYVVSEEGLLCLGETVKSGHEMVRKVDADRCVVPGGEWRPVDVGCDELDAVL